MRNLVLLAIGGIALGCSAGESEWKVTETTSATGVRQVVNTPPAAGIEPTWTIEQELRIGAVEGNGPDSFGNIKGFVVYPDGRIVVLDAQAQELRVFGADGRPLRTFARRGQGPGELADANGLVLGHDGLIRVNDPRNDRLSFFHADSGFVQSVQADIKSYGYLWNATIDSANHVWEQGLVMTAGQRFYALKGYDPQGLWTDTIRLPERPAADNNRGVYSYTTKTSQGFRRVPYWPTPVSTFDPRRALWSKPSMENDYRIVRATFNGDTTLIFESRRPAAPVTQAERDSQIVSLRKWAGSDLDWSQIPSTKPIVTQLFVADEGDVWVRVTTTDLLTTYDVFSSDGRFQGTAVTSMKVSQWLTPIVRGNRFWAVVTDDLDVAYIVRGRFDRRES